MKQIFSSVIVLLLSASAFADYGLIECASKSKDQQVTLSMDEVSDISTDTVSLLVDSQSKKVSRVAVKETDYGILAIQAQVGMGPGKYRYLFMNLGSSECFGVYGSNQEGPAYVEVANSLGVIAKLECACSQD